MGFSMLLRGSPIALSSQQSLLIFHRSSVVNKICLPIASFRQVKMLWGKAYLVVAMKNLRNQHPNSLTNAKQWKSTIGLNS